MTNRCLVVMLAIGCGDNVTPLAADAAPAVPDARGLGCTGTFRGNFADSSATRTSCATISETTLALTVPSMVLAAPLAISIDLGSSPTTGPYSSETVQAWNASGMRVIDFDNCLYVAGDSVVPHGNFTLSIDAVEPTRGSLELHLTVLQPPFAFCGTDLEETVDVAF